MRIQACNFSQICFLCWQRFSLEGRIQFDGISLTKESRIPTNKVGGQKLLTDQVFQLVIIILLLNLFCMLCSFKN